MLTAADDAFARRRRHQEVVPVENPASRNYTVSGGLMKETPKPISPDSLAKRILDTAEPDSLTALSLGITVAELDSLRSSFSADSSQFVAKVDSLSVPSGQQSSTVLGSSQAEVQMVDVLSRREQRQQDRAERLADTTIIRHNNIFNDSIPISRVTAISLIVPGFGQVYNNQPWKLPILYSTVAAGVYFGSKQNKSYKSYKSQYDQLIKYGIKDRKILDPIQDKMIKYNTRRQILFVGALASYIYFVGDGAVNYPGKLTSVKKATTLSTIFPGAGQIYNKSYWKAPIVIGGIATFAYVIDWNNRGYKRYSDALDILTDGNNDTHTEFYRNGVEPYDAKQYRNLKRDFRRNRDLAIILAAGFYVLNIIDAHVDAHLKDYDVSDDLSFNLQPAMFTHSNPGSGRGNVTMVGFNFNVTF